MDQTVKIPKRILATLMDSVAAGVVPRTGAPYLAIGRADEVAAMLSMLERVAEGGSSTKFIIGKYGSGKSFLIQLIRGYALGQGFVTADADLSPERRFSGTQGTGVATYRELIRNLATKTAPEGGAVSSIIARWLTAAQTELAASGLDPDSLAFAAEMKKTIYGVAKNLQDHVGGYDFAKVICSYYEAYMAGDDGTMALCLKWLRGEYRTRTEARQELKVSDIIRDENWYDYIKLWAMFVKLTGYQGLVVFIDECVNLYKISNRISRENNYEKILSMFNDTLEGRASYLGLVMGGTPQFLEDPRRGLFSYEALRSRLCDGRYSGEEGAAFKNFMGPVIRLRRLSDDELYALITRVEKLHAQNYAWDPAARISEVQRLAFFRRAVSRAGADLLITPREIIRDYMSILNLLLQNPDADCDAIMATLTPTAAAVTSEEATPLAAEAAPAGQTANVDLSVLDF